MNADLNEPLLNRNNEERKDNNQEVINNNNINDNQSESSISDRLQSFFDIDNERNLNWNKIEIGISCICLFTLFLFYCTNKDDPFYQAELKDAYVIYICYISLIRLPCLFQILHFLHTYKHCSSDIDCICIILDMMYFFIFILHKLHLGDHIMSSYNMLTLPLSFVIIMFYLTTVRGFLMFLIFCIFKPINFIITPIFDWITKKKVEELTSVTYHDAIQYLSIQQTGEYECAICLDYINDSNDCAVLCCQSRHIFHYECLKSWMKSRMCCPMDREEISSSGINLIHQEIRNIV